MSGRRDLLKNLLEQLDFDRVIDPFGISTLLPFSLPNGNGVRMRIVEKADKFVIKAEVPGFEEDQIRVDTTGRRLTISGSKEIDGEDEFSSSKFEKNFTIPQDVISDNITALLKAGVLTLELPKRKDDSEKKSVKILTESPSE